MIFMAHFYIGLSLAPTPKYPATCSSRKSMLILWSAEMKISFFKSLAGKMLRKALSLLCDNISTLLATGIKGTERI